VVVEQVLPQVEPQVQAVLVVVVQVQLMQLMVVMEQLTQVAVVVVQVVWLLLAHQMVVTAAQVLS
jgi:hypothetical protein